ncbi:MAG TPA: response regulator [Syntrophaceae bacterium]|nr:response regulator [Syntrophaceae bacterium]
MGARILVVDDDPEILEAIEIILQASGYQVVTAKDGEEGLAKLKDERPDLMILDLLMPKMDGFEVCKQLKDPRMVKYANVPIIVLTAVPEKAGQRRYELETGLRMDVDDYVEKPIERSTLLERVEKLLKKAGKV